MRFSGMLDLYGRRLMAYHLSPTETSKAEIAVFQRAFDAVGEEIHPMIHTDCGPAYTSNEFNDFLVLFKVTRSMSRDQAHRMITPQWSDGGTNSSYAD